MNKHWFSGFSFACLSVLGASGCTTTSMINDIVVDPPQPRTIMASSAQATKSSELEQVDLTTLVRARTIELGCASPGDFQLRRNALAAGAVNETKPGGEQDRDFEEFYFYLTKFDTCAAGSAMSRNQMQDLILAVSDRQCRNYVALLQTYESSIDFGTGALATLTGGLSAIFTNSAASRALGGSAGIISGIGAEFDSAYFKQQMVGVLMSGINIERREIHADIREKQALASYTLEAALKDSIRYNAACSLATAVDRLKHEIAQDRGIGLDVARQIVKKTNILSAELDLRDPAKREESAKFLREQDAAQEKNKLDVDLLHALDEKNVADQKAEQFKATLNAKNASLKEASDQAAAAKAVFDGLAADSTDKAAAKTKMEAAAAVKAALEKELETAKISADVAEQIRQNADNRYDVLYGKRQCLSLPAENSIYFNAVDADGDIAGSVIGDADTVLGQAAKQAVCSGATNVTVTGFADSVGTAEANSQTAKERALYVAGKLQERLGALIAVTAVSDGEKSAAAALGQEKADPQYRRVDIRSIR